MRSPWLLVLMLAGGAAAAPVPKETDRDRWERRYGKPRDAKNQAEFAFDDAGLTITLPDDTPGLMGPGDVPHTARPVSGDFVARVRVACPEPKEAGKPGNANFGGGLLLTDPADAKFWIYFGPSVTTAAKKPGAATWGRVIEFAQHFTPRQPGGVTPGSGLTLQKEDGDPVEVRLTRKGSKVTFEYRGGETWNRVYAGEVDANLSDALTLGLTATNNLGRKARVRFTEFEVTGGK